MKDLRAMHVCGDQRHRLVRRHCLFMDAVVKLVRQHSGRVDLTAFRHPGAYAVGRDGSAFTSYPTILNANFAELNEVCQKRTVAAVLGELRVLVDEEEAEARRVTVDWEEVTAQYQRLS
jgi:NAD-dependent oxidoreductase involved in siderophore biosynthesis